VRRLPGLNKQDTHQGINSVYTVEGGGTMNRATSRVSIRPFRETRRKGNFIRRSKGAIGQITCYHFRFKLMLTHGDEVIIKSPDTGSEYTDPVGKNEVPFCLTVIGRVLRALIKFVLSGLR